MRKRALKISIAAIFAALVVTLPLAGYLQKVYAAHQPQDMPKAGAEALTTTEKDQVDLAVTVYNSNVALVRDMRQIHFSAGRFPPQIRRRRRLHQSRHRPFPLAHRRRQAQRGRAELRIRPPRSAKAPAKIRGPRSHARPRGKRRRLHKMGRNQSPLLADNNGPVWKVGDEIVTGMTADSYRFPDLPGNLYSRPTLVWTLDNRGSNAQKVEASYLTSNMSWSADYVLTVTRDEKSADLDGWVTLANNSGVAYDNAKLQLVAGEIHQVTPVVTMEAMGQAVKTMQRAGSAAISARSVFGVPPLLARAPHFHPEQRIKANQPAHRHRHPRRKISLGRRTALLLPQSARHRQRHPRSR